MNLRQIKQNDVLISKKGTEHKVIGRTMLNAVIENSELIGGWGWYTINELEDMGFIIRPY